MDTGSENREETQSNQSSEMSENKEEDEARAQTVNEPSEVPSTQAESIPADQMRGSVDGLAAG